MISVFDIVVVVAATLSVAAAVFIMMLLYVGSALRHDAREREKRYKRQARNTED